MSSVDRSGVKVARAMKPRRDVGATDSLSPESRRLRTLAVLALARHGFKRRHMAEWFKVSDRLIYKMLREARAAAGRIGYGK